MSKKKHFMDFNEDGEKPKPRVIPADILSELVKISNKLFTKSRAANPTYSLKLMADITRINSNSKYHFLTSPLFKEYIDLFSRFPRNNVMHNQIKKILVHGLKHNPTQ